jgi:hypothetical protein
MKQAVSRHGAWAGAVFALAFLFVPALAFAQDISGVARDASGGVLPGVTVEAASPALIEKVRSATTDGSGLYRITGLQPGTYSVTYTLPGFVTVKRDGLDVRTGVALTLNADMRVGGVQETITVTGETPIVDVQSSTRRQTVLDDSVIAALPASRGYGNLLATVPGIQATGLDVSSGVSTNFFTSRGGRGNEGTIQIDGMNVGSAFNGGGVAGFGYDTANAQEIQLTVSGGLGEADRGGPAFNMIPKTGGNTFAGSGFFSTAGKWSQGDNLDARLLGYGFRPGAALIKNYDDNFSLGGPVLRDRLWFYGNARVYGNQTEVPNALANANAGNAARWDFAADPTLKVRSASGKKIAAIRLTGQATPKNKLTFYYDYQQVCNGSAFAKGGQQCRDRGDDWVALGGTTAAPETANVWDDREKIVQTAWTSTATNKLLLEAGLSSFNSRWGGYIPAGSGTHLIPVTEQSTLAGVPFANYTYRGWVSPPSNDQQHNVWRASASYVTGAHSVKVGYQAAYQVQHQYQKADSQISYTFNNRTPISLTLRDAPHSLSNRTRFDAFFVQDQWTKGRVTFQGGLRYEHAWSWYPGGENGILEDNQFASKFLFPETTGVRGYHDINPRGGVAWDVFGTGKTSLKANLGQYLQAANNDAQFTIANFAGTLQQTTTRTWNDANANYVADCDLRNPAANGECGVWANSNFGNPFGATAVNPDVLSGWGVRPFDVQWGVSLQQQLLPRVSADLSYNHRAWKNFFYTDNRAIGPQDFDKVNITAPSNANLPSGGGYPVTFLTRNTRSPLGATDNYYTFASDYGDVSSYYHSVDLNVNARVIGGLVLQGGTSTGRGVRDFCDVLDDLPELYVSAPNQGFLNWQQGSCGVTEQWLTSLRGLVSYTIPKADVLISASMRSVPNVTPATTNNFVATNGASLAANYVISPALFTQLTGRTLAPGLANQTVDLNLPGQLYGERVNSMDMRFGKIVRFGRTRTNVAVDLYNLFNANTGTAYQQAYDPLTNGAAYRRETTVLSPRFMRFNVTVDF